MVGLALAVLEVVDVVEVVEVVVDVQTGVSIGVSMTTVTGPVHGVKVAEVVEDPRYGMVMVVVCGGHDSRLTALAPRTM